MILLDHRDLYRRKSGGDEVDDSDERGLRGGQGAEGKNTLDSNLIPSIGYTKKALWLYNPEWR